MFHHTHRIIRRWLLLLALLPWALPFFSCSGTDFSNALSGLVISDNLAVANSQVVLYATGTGQGPQVLGEANANAAGFFIIPYDTPAEPNAVLYVTADSPDQPMLLASVLGTSPVPTQIVVNERTTIATAYAMAQFFNSNGIDGTAPGLPNAAATAQNLVQIETGEVASVLGNFPNGAATSTMATFNSLANLLAACGASVANCDSLFILATPPQGTVPSDTLQAAVNIAHFPWQNVSELFALSQAQSPFTPALAPDAILNAWTLALRYQGNGQELSGPGNIAFDEDGNAWVANNYVFQLDPFDPEGRVCGDTHVLRFTPTGENFPGAPYQGGGLYGVGFGINFDPTGNIWLANFGFQGANCPNSIEELSQTVSLFNSEGTPLSPNSQGDGIGQDHGGFQGAGNTIRQPQGIVSDLNGNIWITNCGGNSVTQFPGGDPNAAFAIAPLDENNAPLPINPFDVAIDLAGNAWVSSNANDSVFAFDPSGNLIHSISGAQASAAGILHPMGVAGDSLGNIWVSNSGIIHLPCAGSTDVPEDAVNESLQPGFTGENASVTMISADGTPAQSPFKGGGLILPWGIAVDGNDNVWVANFAGQRLSNLCGAKPETCPAGFQTGDAISPAEGYSSDALVRNTGVTIDPSGNVWLTNNWEIIPIQQNPGGHELVVFIGLAKPVNAPLIGPPNQ